MSKNRNVTCDECGKIFKVTKPKTKRHLDGIEGNLKISYFSCKHCKKKYVTFVENSKIRALINENRKMYRVLAFITDEKEYSNAYGEYITLQRTIDTLRKSLIFRFSRYV